MRRSSVTAHRRAVLLGLAGASLAPVAIGKIPPRWPRAVALLSGYVTDRKISGAVLTVRHGGASPQVSHIGAAEFGGWAATSLTLWRIFSMSKPITGVAALALESDGKLSLSQPVADFVPEFANLRVLENGVTRPARRPMLVSHLLTHTAGLGYAINAGTPLAELYKDAVLNPGDPTPRANAPRSLDEFGARLATMPLGSDPGTRFEYSVGLDLLGLVIQRASGMAFDSYLKTRLFDPLRMTDTGFQTPPGAGARLAQNYAVRNGVLTPLEDLTRSPYLAAPPYPSGGGGMVSSARDYDRFCAMLLNDGTLDGVRVLAPAVAQRTHANLFPAGVVGEDGSAFGAGMGIVTQASAVTGQDIAGAYGWAGAAGTLMWIDPAHRLSVVLMTQFTPSNAYPIWSELKRAIYADIAS